MQYMEYESYVRSISHRFIRYRGSAMLDEQDLRSVALTALWEMECKEGVLEEKLARRAARNSMLRALKKSALIHVPQSTPMRQTIEAYRRMEEWTESMDAGHSPIDSWTEAEPVRVVQCIVEGFPQRDQLILSLVWEHGMSIREVADILDMSKSSVHRRYLDLIKQIQSQVKTKEE